MDLDNFLEKEGFKKFVFALGPGWTNYRENIIKKDESTYLYGTSSESFTKKISTPKEFYEARIENLNLKINATKDKIKALENAIHVYEGAVNLTKEQLKEYEKDNTQ